MKMMYLKKNPISEMPVISKVLRICLWLFLIIMMSKITSAQIDPLEYPPGHPNVTVSAVQQLQTFPTPRYKPGHTLMPNYNVMDPIYFGGRFQPGTTDAQAVTNSVAVQTELAKYFNYMVNVTWSSGDQFNNAWINLANANPQWKIALMTLRAQVGGTKLWYSGFPNDHYIQNASGQFLDWDGNVTSSKTWRPTAPVSDYNVDGTTAKNYISSATAALTRNIDMVNEDGEVYPFLTNTALSLDPVVTSAKNASGLDWENFLAQKVRYNDNGYRDQIMSLPKLSGAKYTEYRLDGHRTYQFRWEQSRYMNSPINGQYYSTPDLYVRWPYNWKDWVSAWHGLKWITQSRYYELAMGDKLFSPFVAAGWDANPEVDVRPAQWLGLLKIMGMYGSEFYYTGYFNEAASYTPPNPPPHDPRGYAWQAVMPSYAQAVTSRFEDILRNGSLLAGDMTDNTVSPAVPFYQFSTGATNKVVVIRKKDNANIYAITGAIENNSNTIGSALLVDDAAITLNGQSLKFKIRRQGSTYIYDNTNTSAPVFYQLDAWHESSHPYRWNKDFNIEAELYDNTNASYTIKTSVPSGTSSGDFRNFTSYLTFPDAQTSFTPIEYTFTPRDASSATYYIWVKVRSRVNGVTTGMTITVDNANSKSIGCVSDTTWNWYRLDACSQQPIAYTNLSLQNHVLRITPSNSKLEIDQIVLTTSSSTVFSPAGPACSSSTASVSASGPLSFCQGGNVVLTASSGLSYLWTPGNQTTQSITVSTSGTYSVNVGLGSGCSATSAPQAVSVVSAPSATITPNGATTFCQGGSVVLSASTGSSYLWTPGGQTSQSVTISASGSYTVRVTNSTGCSATSSPTSVTVLNTPSATITAGGATTFCQGGSVVLTASSGTGYLWTPGNQTTQSITSTTSGSYTVRVTASGGCSATSSPVNVTVITNPTAIITAGGPTTICQGEHVTLTANPGTAYLWTPGNQTTQSVDATSSGNYSVKVTASGGCSATSSPVSVTVNSNPVATITAGGSTTFCQGGSVTLTSSSGSSYLWLPGNATTQAVTVSASGTYSVRVTNSNGCSATSSPQNVTVNVPAVPTITPSGSTTINQGQTVTLTSSAGASYLWTPGGATTQSLTTGAAGSYRVTVTYANGCSAISAITVVTVNNTTPVAITVNGATSICPGDSVLLTATSGLNYLWLPGLQTSSSIYATTGGTYTVQASNGTSAQIDITLKDQPMTPAITISYIPNSAYQLTAYEPSAVSYLWSNGQTMQTITMTSAGNVSVKAINNSGCISNAQTMAVANPIASPCTKANMLTVYNIIDVAAMVSWNPAITADSFVVSYAPVGTTNYQYVTVPGNVSGIKIGGLTPGTAYQWFVKTFCSGVAQTSVTSTFTTLSAPLSCGSTPIDLSTTNILQNSAKLNWYNTSAQQYSVRYKKAGTSSYLYKTVNAALSPNSTRLAELSINSTYEWSVLSVCNGNQSAYSPKMYFTTTDTCAPAGTIYQVDVSFDQATIGWDPSIAVDTFKIRYAMEGSLDFKWKNVMGLPNLGHGQINGLQPDTYYDVRVRTKCLSGGKSAWSNKIVIHTSPAPAIRTDAGDPLQLNAYPNPAHDKINYAFKTETSSEYTVKVADMSGRELFRNVRNANAGLNGDDLDVRGYSNGIYMLIVEQGPAISRFKFSIH